MTRALRVALAALAVVACGDGEPDQPQGTRLSATLDMDIRYQAEVTLTVRGEALDAQVRLDHGFLVAPEGTALRGSGRVERFPEADATLYTALLTAEPTPSGPCGDQSVTLALALHRAGDGEYVAGSLTPYCGKDVSSGDFARNPLRLSGNMKTP